MGTSSGTFNVMIIVRIMAFLGIILTFTYSYQNYNPQFNLKIVEIEGNLSEISTTTVSPVFKRPGEIVILMFTKYYGEDPTIYFELDARANPKCFAKCRVVTDKAYWEVSDAVVFHSRDFKKRYELPGIHPWSQIWVYLQQESPSYTEVNLERFPNVFNWTMTYRRDSDVYHPYKKFLPVGSSELVSFNKSKIKDVTTKRRKLVVWIVSHCKTRGRRERYVNELKKFVPVDVFGKCGEFNCSHTGSGEDCIADIAKDYKFYLSFENSACEDYITEKFFRALEYNMVPVVYGGADYNSIAPRGSFINVQNFSSPEELAKYLLELDKDEEKYLKYFEWANKFKVVPGEGWCSLCKKLAKQKVHPVEKTYGNIRKWWFNVNYQEEGWEDSSSLVHKGEGNISRRNFDVDNPLQPACHDAGVRTGLGMMSRALLFFLFYICWLENG